MNKYGELFNESMTSEEARLALFANCDGKDKSEMNKLFSAYESVSGLILKRELDRADEGWLS